MKLRMLWMPAVMGFLVNAGAQEGLTWEKAVPGDDGFLMCLRARTATSSFIEVDAGTEYDVTGTFMRNARIGLLYFCLLPYDRDKQQIQRFHVDNLAGTESTMADSPAYERFVSRKSPRLACSKPMRERRLVISPMRRKRRSAEAPPPLNCMRM